MLQIILMILVVGFFVKMSRRPGTPLWLTYVFKLITLLMLLYIIFIVSNTELGSPFSIIITAAIGILSILLVIQEYRKYRKRKTEAQKLIDEIGK